MMKIYLLEYSISVPVSMREAFEFFENPHNLARITPPWLNFRIAPGQPVEMRTGLEIRYQVRWLSLRMNWKSLIAEYEPPFFFVDVQTVGPYAFWRHRHDFKPSEYGTIVSDRVEYALPLGPVGQLAHRLVVGRQLRQIFDYRHKALTEILTGAPTAR